MDPAQSPFERFRAICTLRDLGTSEAIDTLGRCLVEDGSALRLHEVAYGMGRLQDPLCVPHLRAALQDGPSPMVRHEASEALGNVGTEECVELLKRALDEEQAAEVKESCEVALDNISYSETRATSRAGNSYSRRSLPLPW